MPPVPFLDEAAAGTRGSAARRGSMSDRLLIVDDEPDFADVVERVARSCGYEVRGETQPARAFEHMASWAPTHVVLDLSMPGVDGVTMLRRFASEGCKAKIILVSGVDPRVLDTARRIGLERGLEIAGAIPKPVRMGALRDLLVSLVTPSAALDSEALARAMTAREMHLVYQPKLSLAGGEVCGFEALLRWRHPVLGPISPLATVAAAEESGIIDSLTMWVAGRALDQLAAWRRAGLPVSVAVNVSPLNLRENDFPDKLEELCRSAGLAPCDVGLEVTETAPMQDMLEAMDVLTRLRLKGFDLSLDDFGTGHSTLVQLHRLPFTELKIDRQFVAECAATGTAAKIVQSMIDLCRNLSLRTVAEGVEDEAIMNHLREAGCDLAQGYFISRPLAAENVAGWLAQNTPQAPASVQLGSRTGSR